MPIPSPFHERTAPLCTSHRFKDWAGYLAVCSYDVTHDPEYFAFRHATGAIDVSPLYKYDVTGPDAARLLARMTVRDITRLKVGRVTYTCWCDDQGKVIDDGTVSRLGDEHFRLTAAEPTWHWLDSLADGYRARIRDTTAEIAALALQGPTSRALLAAVSDADIDRLRFFRTTRARIGGHEGWITRTGYTGDLGYEVWVAADDAVAVWDALADAGRSFGFTPAGLDALDVTRIEAGFIMAGVDYYSAPTVVLPRYKSTPDEIGLGWTVQLDRAPFVGQAAIAAERSRPAEWRLVGLEVGWEGLERLYAEHGLPPGLPAHASREAIPIFDSPGGGRQIGRATSHTWSPTLKRMLALASVEARFAAPGTELGIEHTVDWARSVVPAKVVDPPFFDPPRKRKP